MRTIVLCCALVVAQGCSASRRALSDPLTTPAKLQACGGYLEPAMYPGTQPGIVYVRVEVTMAVDAYGRVVPSSVRAGSTVAGSGNDKAADARARAVSDAMLCSFVPATKGGVAVASRVGKVFIYAQ
jgi:hypothetical protein